VRYFAGGYYYVAKHQRGEHLRQAKHGGSGAPPKAFARQEPVAAETADAKPEPASK
jgi:hypothetical protein